MGGGGNLPSSSSSLDPDPRQTAFGYTVQAPEESGRGMPLQPHGTQNIPPSSSQVGGVGAHLATGGGLGIGSASSAQTLFDSTDTLGGKTTFSSQFQTQLTQLQLPPGVSSMGPPLLATPRGSPAQDGGHTRPEDIGGVQDKWRQRWRLRNTMGNFASGRSLEAQSQVKTSIRLKTSLPLQLGLSFEVPFVIIYVIWTFIATIYKNQALPHNPEGIDRGAEEVILLILYFLLQPCRLRIGSLGNRCENALALGAFIFLTFGTLFIHGYFLTVQVYVLKYDLIFNIIGMSVEILCVLFAFYVSIIRIGGQNRDLFFALGSLSLCVFAVLFVLLYNWKQTSVEAPCPIDGSLQCRTIFYGEPPS